MSENDSNAAQELLKSPLALAEIFQNINSMLQFAESKNGALAVLNFTIIVGIGAAWNVGIFDNFWVKIYVEVLVAFLSVSGILAFSTFYPRTSLHRESGEWYNREPASLLFFGDIAEV
ncbi:hypothetical protein [Phyllobacterium zundukense]|uniref:Pycsar effector protein domain-containing protein n=1 Tax=Phyllobacterium zundukense TaxID=1867719 RepID=A0A2N9VZZ9_9HYPH|nr:hypothetical protein [Phyllobacterium zundukense]ATU94458.1 hypothetical protein BLM14_22280 [Phyllobacterium zundukense]PIO45067.1 hypothetical protein B5P45_09710 [Phyllobacterium zundukense]